MIGPEPIERTDAVDEALGVVEPVDADREPLTVEAAAQPRHIRMRRRFRCVLRELLGIDADREDLAARSAMLRDRNAVFDGEAEFARDIAEKILAIVMGLEADQIVGQHRHDQLAMIGYALHYRSDRPWRMEEEADRIVDAEVPQLRAEREEMVILHPERGLRFPEAHQVARHEGVDLAIADIVVTRDADQIAARVQRRPQ